MPSKNSPSSSVPPERRLEAEARLELAGRALDPNGGPRAGGRGVARDLLASAARLAIVHLAPDGDVGTSPAGDEGVEGLARAAATVGLTAVETAAVQSVLDGVPDVDLAVAELAVTKLVDGMGPRPRWPGATRRARIATRVAALAGAILLVAGIVAARPVRRPSDAYTFRASSADVGFSEDGTLGRHGAWELVFHTKREQAPWVEIDLGQMRVVSRVILRQRTDCCSERGVPLVVEVAGEGGEFSEVAAREEPFVEWEATFSPREARRVRIRALKRTFLHYRDIEIR